MAFCTECGKQQPDGTRFCIECGAPIAASGPQPASGSQPAPVAKPAPAAKPEPVAQPAPAAKPAPGSQPASGSQRPYQPQYQPAPPQQGYAQAGYAQGGYAQGGYAQGGYAQPAYAPQPAYGAPPAPPQSGKRARGAAGVMGVGAYLGTLLLLCIPLVGLVLCIVWACGGTANLNRRNLARAYLILMLIMAVLSAGLYFAMRALFGSVLEELYGLSAYGDLGALSEYGDLGEIGGVTGGGASENPLQDFLSSLE